MPTVIPQWLIELGKVLPVPQLEFQRAITGLNDAGADLLRFGHRVMYELMDPESTWFQQPLCCTSLQRKAVHARLRDLHSRVMDGELPTADFQHQFEALLHEANDDDHILLAGLYCTPETLARHLLSSAGRPEPEPECQEKEVAMRSALAKLLMHLLREERLKIPVPA